MKKYIVVLALSISAIAGAQSLTQYNFQQDNLALKTNLPDFTYFSTNYEKVFGEYTYTFNTLNFGQRNVYVSDSNFYYHGSQNLPYIPSLNQSFVPCENNSTVGAIGISVAGLTALFSGSLFEKDYSPKNIDSSLFRSQQ